MTINIIYVRGTVSQVLPFVYSLLEHTDVLFRLVSNGCNDLEERELKDFANSNERLTFHSINSKTILLHHEVLHLLLKLEESPYFAFVDSDILAKEAFVDDLLKELKEKEAVFTGLPLWHEESEMTLPRDFKIAGGRFVKAHTGHLLGLSYAAIYRREPLVEFIKASGIDLRKYKWNEVPEHWQVVLKKKQLDKSIYDTGKLLNMVWQFEGAQMSFCDIDSLIHLGGISGKSRQKQISGSLRFKVSGILPHFVRSLIFILRLRLNSISWKESIDMSRLVRKRNTSAELLGRLVSDTGFLISKSDLKGFPSELAGKIEAATKHISSLIENSKQKKELINE